MCGQIKKGHLCPGVPLGGPPGFQGGGICRYPRKNDGVLGGKKKGDDKSQWPGFQDPRWYQTFRPQGSDAWVTESARACSYYSS